MMRVVADGGFVEPKAQSQALKFALQHDFGFTLMDA